MQIVTRADSETLARMADFYGSPAKQLPGAIFRGKHHGTTVTGYRSGKVMFQGADPKAEAERWQLSARNTADQHRGDLPAGFDHLAVLGSDEVGVGSYFGPLTVAAVFVDRDHVAPIEQLGVQDSKQLSDPQIIRLAKKIIRQCPYHIVNLDPPTYNRLMKRYGNQAQLKALCHNLALAKVLDKIKPQQPEAVLIDEFVAPATYYRYLKGQKRIVKSNVYFHVRGESEHVAVAAGSIVARYYSLQRMDALSEKAGMTLPIGAGTNVDDVAASLLRHGQDLGQFAKLHFANTAKARKMAQ